MSHTASPYREGAARQAATENAISDSVWHDADPLNEEPFYVYLVTTRFPPSVTDLGLAVDELDQML